MCICFSFFFQSAPQTEDPAKEVSSEPTSAPANLDIPGSVVKLPNKKESGKFFFTDFKRIDLVP